LIDNILWKPFLQPTPHSLPQHPNNHIPIKYGCQPTQHKPTQTKPAGCSLTKEARAANTSQPTRQATNQPTNHPTNHPTNQPTNQPVNALTKQPTTHRPTNQPPNQPINNQPNQSN
jgi:PT repeat